MTVSPTGVATRAISIVLMAVLLVGCGGSTPSGERGAASGEPAALGSGLGADLPAPKATVIPEPKHEVYGYVPYWEMDESIADHIGRTELTTLALFSVTHRGNGKLDNQTGLRRIRGDVGAAVPGRGSVNDYSVARGLGQAGLTLADLDGAKAVIVSLLRNHSPEPGFVAAVTQFIDTNERTRTSITSTLTPSASSAAASCCASRS